MAVDSELLRTFREETSERLDDMVRTLLAIEAQGVDGDLIAGLFRNAHSIKGNAGMLGFGEAQEIAHAMEDAIGAAEANQALAAGVIDSLLAAVDAIRDVVTGATGRAPGVVAALTAEADGAVAPPPAVAVSPQPAQGSSAAAPRSIRVEAERVDRLVDLVGETVLHRGRLGQLVAGDRPSGESVEEELGEGDRLLDELQRSAIRLRTLPLGSITATYPRAVRDLAASAGKQVRLTLTGTDTQLDRLVLDGISETIVHLLRNCVSHGIETPVQRRTAGKPELGQLELRAEARGEWVAVSVRDDGAGVSPALLARSRERGSLAAVLAEAGLSTATEVTELSGRGVGFDAVKRHVESLGGTVEADSQPGVGTSVTLLLPLMVSLVRLLLIESRGQVFGVPLANAVEVLALDQTLSLGGRQSIEVRNELVAVRDVREALSGEPSETRRYAVIVSTPGRRVAITCDAVLGDCEAVIRSLGPLLSGLPSYLGAAILADARIALILDPAFLVAVDAGRTPPTGGAMRGDDALPADGAAPATARRGRKVLVVDDQFTVRELERSILETAGYSVVTAEDGRAALDVLQRDADVALVLTDIEMPNVTGLELLAAIRSAPARASLPVVVVTSRGDAEDRRRGAEAGADAYVVKSEFAQDGLLKIVRRLVDQ